VKLSLKELPFYSSYDSDESNILREFYIPSLSHSILYKRLCGFFSSTSLAIAAEGICELIKNGGRMKLICGAKFTEADVEAIKDAYTKSEALIEDNFFEELENIIDEFVKDHVRAFGWMLANNLLEIKIAIVYDELGNVLDYRSIERRGIFHQKVGILEDAEENRLSFSGSQNETASGWYGNIEEFKVFRNWMDIEKSYFEADFKKFEKFWNGYSSRVKIIGLPNAIKNKLIEIRPDNIEDLNLTKWYVDKKEEKKYIILRDYQKEAINNWLLNDKIGIFEMATGTGKTYAALGCLSSVINKEQGILAVIACPYNHLIPQWIKNIDNFGIESKIIIADSTNPGWRNQLVDKIIDLETKNEKHLIVLTTHDTLPSEDFKEIMRQSDVKIVLIVDEVHGIGAPERRKALLDKYIYRLGLSATPRRWFDPEGTEILFKYFDKTVYDFPLNKAIGRFLIEYEYYPYFVTLTNDELEKYENETKKIAKAYYASKNDDEKDEWYNLLCIKRQNIVKTAYKKYDVLRQIIKQNKNIRHCLIYCDSKQLETVQDILLYNNIIQHKFTQNEGIRPINKYRGISERDYLLQEFSKGTIQVLVAMKCLDEGVDIRPAKFAIMMSNSGNPREYIQRRGRILRKHEKKKIAIIHDIIVTPSHTMLIDSDLAQLEKKIYSKELIRYKEFSALANNAVECYKSIEELENKYMYR